MTSEATDTATNEAASATSATPAPAKASVAAAVAAGTEATTPEPKKIKVGDEEYEADERGDIKLPVKAFESRLRRASKAALTEAFGTTDVESIKKKMARAEELEAAAEESKRKQMSDMERLQADLDKRNAEYEAAVARLTEVQSEREFEQTDSVVMTTATKHVAPKYAGVVAIQFGQYVRDELTNKQAAAMEAKDIEAWFEDYARENPELAAKGAKPTKEPLETRKEALTVGATDRKPTPKPEGGVGTKTAKPGQPNSMTDAEWQAWKKQNGISY